MIRRIVFPVGLLLLGVGLARAQTEEIIVAAFVPSAYLPSAQARSEIAQSLAAQLGEKVGRRARGVAFARARDLETATARGEVHAAVLDPIYVAGRRALKVLATARRGSAIEVSAIAVSRLEGRGIPAFRGKRLIVPAAGGAEIRFVENFVLEGQVPAREFWSAIGTAPDAASAIAAVAAGQADVAIVLDSPEARSFAAQRGLRVGFSTRSFPGPALAWVATAPDAALQSSLGAATRGMRAGPLGDAWGPPASGYQALLAAPSLPRPFFGAPAPVPFRAPTAVNTPASDLDLPPPPPALIASPARLP